MNLKQYRGIADALNADLKSVFERHGLKMDRVRASVDEMCGTIRYTIEAADATMNPDAERYKKMCSLYRLAPEWLGRKFLMSGRSYTVAGLKDTRGEKCVVLTRDDGKTFVTKPDALHRQFGGAAATKFALLKNAKTGETDPDGDAVGRHMGANK